jgi:GMP synthase (glutamine-hydrolysing)
MTSWTVLQHVAWEGPGLIAAEAQKHNLSLKIVRIDLAPTLPAIGEIEGLVVMGGPMGYMKLRNTLFLPMNQR